jgi:hypothetical protein
MTDAKFEKFWTTLSDAADLPQELKPHMQTALKAAGYYETPVATVSGAAVAETGGKTKKLSGYNVFMKEKMAELKTQGVASGERMGKVATLWKALKDEEKATWKAKADGLNPTAAVATKSAKASGPKKLSGYQLYVKEQMAVVKNNASIAAKDRMTEIGKTWKALSDAQKAEYKAKAEKL